jgi:hypothetical protein
MVQAWQQQAPWGRSTQHARVRSNACPPHPAPEHMPPPSRVQVSPREYLEAALSPTDGGGDAVAAKNNVRRARGRAAPAPCQLAPAAARTNSKTADAPSLSHTHTPRLQIRASI